ncbi:MAG: hypothetical protein AB8C02_13635 [Halioglobus sp.]
MMQTRIHRCLNLALALCLGTPCLALADVSFETKVTVRANGPIAAFNSETSTRTDISGEKGRTELVPSDDLAAEFSVADVRVTRLDRDVIYEMKPDIKAYRQVSMDEQADQIAGLRNDLETAIGGSALPIATDNCEWSEAKFKSKKTKEKERIAGKRATRHIISMEQSCTDDRTGQSCDIEWIMEPWMTKRLDSYDEVMNFYMGYADRLEMDALVPQMSGGSQMLLAMFPNRWESLLDEMSEFEGYPMRTVMTLKIGGRGCLSSSAVEEDNIWADAADEGFDEAVDRSGKEVGRSVGDAADEAMGDSIGGAVGSSAIGAATGELIDGFGSVFKKKQKQKRKKPQKRRASSDLTVFRITTEITDWDDEPVPLSRYEIPADWERQP